MLWSDALGKAKECLQSIDDYVDNTGVVADALEQIEKHGGPLKAPLRETVELLNRMLNAVVNDPEVVDSDTVPDQPAAVR